MRHLCVFWTDGDDGTWEDIYGRTRTKDGKIVDTKTKNAPSDAPTSGGGGKYVPPALRNAGGMLTHFLSKKNST